VAGSRLLDAATAQQAGYVHLAQWLANAEQLWTRHGRGGLTFSKQIDYYGKLAAQFPLGGLRVVYAASGTLPAAAILKDQRGVVEHKLYWSEVRTEAEARYLLATLNSETARGLAEHLQSRGQWGARDFDKVVLSLPIPSFNSTNRLHRDLAEAAAHAERVAASVEIREGMHFIGARQRVRAELQRDGVSERIDELVARLLGLSSAKA
jgi:hypothetical protein